MRNSQLMTSETQLTVPALMLQQEGDGKIMMYLIYNYKDMFKRKGNLDFAATIPCLQPAGTI